MRRICVKKQWVIMGSVDGYSLVQFKPLFEHPYCDHLLDPEKQAVTKFEWNITVTSQWQAWRFKSPALHCLCNRLFKVISNETAKSTLLALCEWNSPVTGEFPSQRASYAENNSIWWRHNENKKSFRSIKCIGIIVCKMPAISVRLWNMVCLKVVFDIVLCGNREHVLEVLIPKKLKFIPWNKTWNCIYVVRNILLTPVLL